MIRLAGLLRRLIENDEAATMVEYAFMVALIALVVFGTVQVIGTRASTLYTAVAAAF